MQFSKVCFFSKSFFIFFNNLPKKALAEQIVTLAIDVSGTTNHPSKTIIPSLMSNRKAWIHQIDYYQKYQTKRLGFKDSFFD